MGGVQKSWKTSRRDWDFDRRQLSKLKNPETPLPHSESFFWYVKGGRVAEKPSNVGWFWEGGTPLSKLFFFDKDRVGPLHKHTKSDGIFRWFRYLWDAIAAMHRKLAYLDVISIKSLWWFYRYRKYHYLPRDCDPCSTNVSDRVTSLVIPLDKALNTQCFPESPSLLPFRS